MSINYDSELEVYLVTIGSETLCINTKDIVEAREIFIKNMTSLFNDAICEQLKQGF